jgi:hypothetical protein
MPVVLEEGFKFDLSRFSQIPIRNGFEEEWHGLRLRISPILHCSFF